MARASSRALAALSATVVLGGCALWARAALWSEIVDIRSAFETAAAERDRLCVAEPPTCRQRLRLAPEKSPDDPGAWSYELAPSYRVEFDITLARLRPALKRTWLGLDYWNAITGALADRADAGEIRERDASLLTRQAREQSRRMLIEQVNHDADGDGDAAAWQARAFALVSRAVTELNTYTAARTQVRPPEDARVATGAGCTPGVWALRGRALCVMPDGGVETR